MERAGGEARRSGGRFRLLMGRRKRVAGWRLQSWFTHFMMQPGYPAWYCARTKAKHEHIAAANIRKNLELEVFHPQLRVERTTRRGFVRVREPVFPCYIFVHCVIEENLHRLERTNGISTVLHFGDRFPSVAERAMEELQECFGGDEPTVLEEGLSLGDEVVVGGGAFAGMHAFVLRLMPARRRIQILLDVLSGPTPVEVDCGSVTLEKAGAGA